MAVVVKEGKHRYWINGSGIKVHETMVTDEEKLNDEIIVGLVDKAKDMNSRLTALKKEAAETLQALLDVIAEKYGEKKWEGNATLYDFSKQKGIIVSNAKRKEYNATINLAVKKIDQWLEIVTQNGSSNSVIGIVRALTKVDNSGKYDKNNLKKLLAQPIDEETELWEEAMDIIRNSEEVVLTKSHYRFIERNPEKEDEFNDISLNFPRL